MSTTNAKGFTLVELMVVVALVGILATIAIVQFTNYRGKAHNTASLSDLRHTRIEFEAYHADYKHYPY